MSRRGSIFLLLLVGVVAVLAVAVGAASYFGFVSKKDTNMDGGTACTQEAMECPDGSYVGRTGPNCEFAECPGAGVDETAGWQTYRNEEYGFEVKYPDGLTPMDLGALIVFSDGDQGAFRLQVNTGAPGVCQHFEGGVREEKVSISQTEATKVECGYDVEYSFGKQNNNFFIASNRKYLDRNVFDHILSTFKFIEPAQTQTSPPKEIVFSYPYPVQWQTEKGGSVTLTKVALGDIEIASGIASGKLTDLSRDLLYRGKQSVYGIELTLKIHSGGAALCNPLFTSLKLELNEEGDTAFPEIMTNICMTTYSTYDNQKVIFAVPESLTEATIRAINSDGSPNTFFTIKVLSSGTLRVISAPTQG